MPFRALLHTSAPRERGKLRLGIVVIIISFVIVPVIVLFFVLLIFLLVMIIMLLFAQLIGSGTLSSAVIRRNQDLDDG
jgi:hypothetical protein